MMCAPRMSQAHGISDSVIAACQALPRLVHLSVCSSLGTAGSSSSGACSVSAPAAGRRSEGRDPVAPARKADRPSRKEEAAAQGQGGWLTNRALADLEVLTLKHLDWAVGGGLSAAEAQEALPALLKLEALQYLAVSTHTGSVFEALRAELAAQRPLLSLARQPGSALRYCVWDDVTITC